MANYYVVESSYSGPSTITYDGVTYTVKKLTYDIFGARQAVNLNSGDQVFVANNLTGTVAFSTGTGAEGQAVDITLQPPSGSTSPTYTLSFNDPVLAGSLEPTIKVPSNTNFGSVSINGANTDDMNVYIGDNVTFGNITGGNEGVLNGTADGRDDDLVSIGNNSSVGTINLGDGNDTVIAGTNVTFRGTIETSAVDAGALGDTDRDLVNIGSGSRFGTLTMGAGSDTVTLGDSVTSTTMLRLGGGDDKLTTGTKFTAYDVQLDDELTTFEGGADDLAVFGDSVTITNVFYGGPGSDTVSFGVGNNVRDMRMGTENLLGDNGDQVIFRVPPNSGATLYDALSADGWVDTNGDGVYRNSAGTLLDDTFTFAGVNIINVEAVNGPPCFVHGTRIETARGAVAIEDLAVGDLVMTRDNGLQPIRWIGRRVLSAQVLDAQPKLRPIRLRAGSLGQGVPSVDLLVSPQHRVLVRSAIAQRMFDAPEVLVAAKQLCQIDGIDVAEDVAGVEYVHMLFDRHEVVISNGAETESLFTGPEALKALGPASAEEIFAIFPELRDRDHAPSSARLMASGRLARKLAVRHANRSKPLVM